jgi:hypothetical protein
MLLEWLPVANEEYSKGMEVFARAPTMLLSFKCITISERCQSGYDNSLSVQRSNVKGYSSAEYQQARVHE